MRSFLFRAVAVSLFLSSPFTALSAKTWTGAVNSNWSNPGNWSPPAAPVVGEPLVFPSAPVGGFINDLPAGFVAGSLTFQSGDVNLIGNQLTLTGDVTFDPANSLNFFCNAPLKIGATITINGGAKSYYDTLDVNGQTVTFSSTHPVTINKLNGTGTFNALGQGIQITGSGSFSGTLTGACTLNSVLLPNATFSGSTLTGVGTVGNTVVADLLPGSGNSVGYIQTKSLAITHQFSVVVGSNGGQDAALVTGTVTLTGASLVVSFPGFSPPAGTPIVILTNDGTDPIVGTFNGLPEGASFLVNGTTFVISYRGSDGNDITVTPQAPAKTWIGDPSIITPNVHWSDANAWLPHAIPVAGEPLVFANGTTSVMNDLPAGFTVGPLQFLGGSPTINGNALTLSGSVTFPSFQTQFTCNAPLTLGNSVVISGAQTALFTGPIEMNGKALTVNTYRGAVFSGPLNGSGAMSFEVDGAQLSGTGTFSGTINGSVDVSGSIPNATVTAAPFLTGNGSVGSVMAYVLRPGTATLPNGPDQHTFGVLQTKGLVINGGGQYDVDVCATAYDAVHVTGAVSVGGLLSVTVTGTPPAFGQMFVIIDNDGTDPIDGTFMNLPGGSTVHAGNSLFRIFYTGGDGNDVTLIAAAPPAVAVTQAKSQTVIGEKTTFTVSVTSPYGIPPGGVVVSADGSPLGTVFLSNGTASIDVSSLAVGDHAITANYLGAGPYTDAVSPPMTHTVARGETSTTLQAVDRPVYGSSKFTLGVVVKSPASAPLAGSITVRENGKDIASTVISNPSTPVSIPSLGAGTHTLVASYSGTPSLLNSDSLPVSVTVDRAATQLLASYQLTPSGSDGDVALSVTAVPTSSVPDQPSGTITVSESGSTIAHASLSGTTSIPLTLRPGTHLLTISYSGDANYAADSIEYTVQNGEAPLVRHRGVRH